MVVACYPSPQDLFQAREVDTKRQIDGLVRHAPLAVDLHLQSIRIKNGIDGIQRSRLPGAELEETCIRMNRKEMLDAGRRFIERLADAETLY